MANLHSRASGFLLNRSHQLVRQLDCRVEAFFTAWIGLIAAAGALKILAAAASLHTPLDLIPAILPYLLIALSPIAGYRIAAGSFPRGFLSRQPSLRLARFGNWRELDIMAAVRNPRFGPAGFVCSLIGGLLLGVILRTGEYILAVPLITASAPEWARSYFLMMSIDLIAMNFFYMVCFVMALRAVPLFPRMLAFTWALDLLMQVSIARTVTAAGSLPADVATAMASLLEGNVQKVLISVAIWLPYLLLSERVNVTYRRRASVS